MNRSIILPGTAALHSHAHREECGRWQPGQPRRRRKLSPNSCALARCTEGTCIGCPRVYNLTHTDGAIYARWNGATPTVNTLNNYSVYDQRGTIDTFIGVVQGGLPPAEIADRNGNTIYLTLSQSGSKTNPVPLLTFPDTAGRTASSISGNQVPGTFGTLVSGWSHLQRLLDYDIRIDQRHSNHPADDIYFSLFESD